jgi:hypothetical protein
VSTVLAFPQKGRNWYYHFGSLLPCPAPPQCPKCQPHLVLSRWLFRDVDGDLLSMANHQLIPFLDGGEVLDVLADFKSLFDYAIL